MSRIVKQKISRTSSVQTGIKLNIPENFSDSDKKWCEILAKKSRNLIRLQEKSNIYYCNKLLKILKTTRKYDTEYLHINIISILKDLEVRATLKSCYCKKLNLDNFANEAHIQIVLTNLLILFLYTKDFRILNCVVKSVCGDINGINFNNTDLNRITFEILRGQDGD
jgi:hypothetical protein